MDIVLIEDDDELAADIAEALQNAGYTTRTVGSIARAKRVLASQPPRIVILDRLLPDGDAIDLIPWIREQSPTTKILILSALASVEARVGGLNAGADDYLAKPYAMAELQARITALDRRGKQDDRYLNHYSLQLDRLDRRVTVDSGALRLNPREFALLEYLLLHSSEVISREMILHDVWGYNFDPGTNVIDVHISRLRSKLSETSAAGCLSTVRGIGYRLGPPDG